MKLPKTFFFSVFILFLFPAGLWSAIDYNLYVAKDGSAEYTSIQEALNATKSFPDKRITIHVKDGVYKEKIRVYSWNPLVTLKGESREGTVITNDDYFNKMDKGRNSTFHTYTLKVEARDFRAENITIRNTAGPVGQAVALHVEGDRCEFINCRIEGDQDTFYGAGEGARQYFKNCFISGTTDFIFGEATVVFDKCEIHSKSDSYITAASTPEEIPFGLVFLDCNLTAEPDVSNVYLGRPWRPYARTVFINCHMGSHIRPDGWHNWGSNEKEKTTFYAEYGNKGPGADGSRRVSWAHQLSDKEAEKYSVKNIFKAKNTLRDKNAYWLPQK